MYMMCLKVYANGQGDGKGTHVTVAVCLMRGEFDDLLNIMAVPWRFHNTTEEE